MLRKPLIIGNWKMNNTVSESLQLVTALIHGVSKQNLVEVGVAPPATALYSVGIAIASSTLKLCAQNVFYEKEGAFTGEISPLFLKELGCSYVLVGHSERRHVFGETDALVKKKVHAVYRWGMIPVLCVGETLDQREQGKTLEVVEEQLSIALDDISSKDLERFVIAYEPVWAIGTGKTATPEQAEEVHAFIRTYLGKTWDGALANKARVLYGGSVKSDNAAHLMGQDNIDGLLVGGASLKAREFAAIVNYQE